jgi:ankyrin repeat protein
MTWTAESVTTLLVLGQIGRTDPDSEVEDRGIVTSARRSPGCPTRGGRVDRAATVFQIRQSGPVTNADRGPDAYDDGALLALFAAIASGDQLGVTRMLDQSPGLAIRTLRVGASRQAPRPYFLIPISHYVYAGDTALHVVAAAHHRGLAESLIVSGAAVRARNRRGAEPLHYAADGGPDAGLRSSKAQRELISYLIDAGADPDAMDKSGVAPLHRAVRTRGSSAVGALIDKGADPLLMNKSGSTPLHLAVQNTGKSNSGSEAAKQEQRRIIVLLLQHGASPTDLDAKGKTVAAAASSDWIRHLLEEH